MSDPCQYDENDIKTKAYYLKLDNFGKDDDDRYYIAKHLTQRLCNEGCKEIHIDQIKPICRFCHTHNASIETPYLPSDVHVCWFCYFQSSKEKLVELYEKYHNIFQQY